MSENTPFGNSPFATPGGSPTDPFGGSAAGGFEFTLDIPLNADNPSWFIPAGAHAAKLLDVESKTSKSGNPMLVWTYVVTAGESAGKEIKNFTVMSPAAMWKVTETIKALGVSYEPGKQLRFSREQVINTEVVLVISEEVYNEQKRSKIDKVLHPSAGADYGMGGVLPLG